MLLRAHIAHKSIGPRVLYQNLLFHMAEGEKVALIGRNGVGKTTLLSILSKEDTEFEGEVEMGKAIRIIMTKQEHSHVQDITPLAYILTDIPEYFDLKKILDTPVADNDLKKIEQFTNAVGTFSERGYYELEDRILQSLEHFHITLEQAIAPLQLLSGGEKRFVELVRVMYADPDIAFFDEPTNHMDYIGKEDFISWLREVQHVVLIVTHDRDVLHEVDRIVEIKDHTAVSFPGNYDKYLEQNSLASVSAIGDYEIAQKRMGMIKKQITAAKKNKEQSYSTRARRLPERLQREYDTLQEENVKPAIWIDKNSIDQIDQEVVEKYHKYKDRNIHIAIPESKLKGRRLVHVTNLSIGYGMPLFSDISFSLYAGNRIFVRGRNGAGKTTLIKTLLAFMREEKPTVTVYTGEVTFYDRLKIGVYEQEVHPDILTLTLGEAIKKFYFASDIPIHKEKLDQILRNYLFNPFEDRDKLVSMLSGGQKARLQLIKMFANQPDILILDEPTNHLDLPSIEELEDALKQYTGAILYVSHDSYFVKSLGGDVLEIGQRY